MPNHDYTPKEALDLLIKKIESVSPPLATRIRSAIDAGKDIQVEETVLAANRKKKARKRYYRKHIAYTDEEALEVAMTVLESHLVESRMLVNAAHDEFKRVGMAKPKRIETSGQSLAPAEEAIELNMELTSDVTEVLEKESPKKIAVESEPEAVQEKQNLPDVRFEPTIEEELNSLRDVFRVLKSLTDFKEVR